MPSDSSLAARPPLPRLRIGALSGPARLALLAAALVAAGAAFMLWHAAAPWSFLLPFRGSRLAALALVGASVPVAAALFQCAAGNRILTPSAMGFDALYVFILTAIVHIWGAAGYAAIPAPALFFINLVAMTALGMGLFGLLLRGGGRDMVRLVLCGVVLGILIRSVTGFLARMIDPSEFQIAQAMSFASFARIDPQLLGASALVAIPCMVAAFRLRARLDALALGDDIATGLGENPARLRRAALMLVCALSASATALVGPLAGGGAGPSSFFGLVVVAIACRILPTERHAMLLPGVALLGALTLVLGQLATERLFALTTPLPAVIELIGGALFLWLLLKRRSA